MPLPSYIGNSAFSKPVPAAGSSIPGIARGECLYLVIAAIEIVVSLSLSASEAGLPPPHPA